MNKIEIQKFQIGDLVQASKLLNQLFYPMFNAFVNLEYENGPEYIRDFSIINECDEVGLYVIKVNDEISGLMKLKTNDAKAKYKRKASVKKYKFFDRIKTYIILNELDIKVNDDELYVEYIVVDENKRGLGLGTKLLEFGKNQAMLLNKKVYFLHVLKNNPLGKKLYERFGFVQKKESKFPKYVAKRLGTDRDYRMEIKL